MTVREQDKTVFLSAVGWMGRSFEFYKPQKFECHYDPACRTTCIENKPLHIQVFANSTVEFHQKIGQRVAELWDEYAQEDPDKLSPSAKKLRLHILSVVREVT